MKIKPPNFKSEKLPDFSVKLGESSSFKNELKSIAKKLAVDAPKSISSIDKPVVLDEHNLSISITKSPEIKKHSIIKEQTVKKGEIDDLELGHPSLDERQDTMLTSASSDSESDDVSFNNQQLITNEKIGVAQKVLDKIFDKIVALSCTPITKIEFIFELLNEIIDDVHGGAELTDFKPESRATYFNIYTSVLISCYFISAGMVYIIKNNNHSTSEKKAISPQLLNTIKALGIAKKLLELYVNPYKRISLSSILILSDYFLPGKITTKTGNQEQTTNNSQSNRTNIFSRCATSVIILLSINLASLLKFQHSGSLKNIAFPNRNLIGAHNNHPLSPTKNTTFRHVPHNGGSYAKSVENSITKIPSMIMANQRIDIKEQLLMGADIVMLDAAVDKTGDKIESVHSSLKYRKFEDDLKEISTFLQERGNKDRKVAVFIENVNDIKLQQFLDLFNKTGLSEMLPKSKEEWFPEKYKNGGFPSRFFPIIHRNHPIDGIENDKIYPQIAYGKVITTAKELKKCVSEMQNNGLYQLIQPIAMIMTSFEEMFPDQDACPLSCKDLLETIPCVEIINQFGKLPIPAIASSLNSGVEDHAKKCLQTDYNQTLLVALDHTNLN